MDEEELFQRPELYVDIDPQIMAEFMFAEQEFRQPNCIYCGKHLEVGQTFYARIYWHWNSDLRRYEKCEDRDADCDKPYCLNCEVKDWDFTNNKWLQY